MTELHYRSAIDTAGAIASGEITARQVTEHVLHRIDAVNRTVNAVIDIAGDEALAQADDIDATSGSGALRGVPMTVKDALNVAGHATTWGNPEWQHSRADTDATVVTRLRDAGMVFVGKTNVAIMLADYGQSANPLHGVTNNPWDPERAAGGSSGGAAAAVSCGLSYLDYGSDVVGSIRIPASFCGVYGLKPTPGIVPLAGFQPPGPPATPTLLDHMSSLGPLARTAGDIRAALRVTAGPLPPDQRALQWALPPARRDRLADFRVGVVLDDTAASVSSGVGDVLSSVIDTLGQAGVRVREGWPDEFDAKLSRDAFEFMIGAFFAFKQGNAKDGPDLNRLIAVDQQRRQLQAAWDGYFRHIDVLLCPTTVTTAPAHDTRPMDDRTLDTDDGHRPYSDLAAWVGHASIAGLPALSAPAGQARDGLPVGLQIIGPRYEDDTAITFAELLAATVGGHEAPKI